MLPYLGEMTCVLVDGYCHRCGKPVGKVSWDSADYVFHKRCAKAEEVYRPPAIPRPGF